jgi:hypothetical protein
LLAAVLFSACSGVSAAPAPRTLTVTGSSEVFLTPDIAYIQVGVRTQDADVAAAVAQNNTQVERVMATLNDFGIAAEDIRTSNFSLYSFEDSGFEFEGEGGGRGLQYVVENTVYVTVRDLSQMGEVLEAAVESGANNIFGIQFDVADKSAALSEGREAALANAQDRRLRWRWPGTDPVYLVCRQRIPHPGLRWQGRGRRRCRSSALDFPGAAFFQCTGQRYLSN